MCSALKKKQAGPQTLVEKLRQFNNAGQQGQVNGLYVLTNEKRLDETRTVLQGHPRPEKKTIHIGCAGWHNFDIIAARKSDYGLIVDFQSTQCKTHFKDVRVTASCSIALRIRHSLYRLSKWIRW